ncbi:Flagellar hook protein FlgE [Methylibium sp. T29-B]|nr:Flagellar hook protein FlgE [Methylibium sp. T29-B]
MSFQQGLSGLNAASKNLEIIGNNVANASTFGAKSSRAEFGDVYANALNGSGTNMVGIGVNLATVAQQFTQGNITTTDNPMDLAINGSGFFQVSDGKNPTMYARNGQFKIDREGFIVNNSGYKLLGYPADGQGVIVPGQAQAIQLPTAGIAPRATDRIAIEMNLDARQAVTTPATGGIDFDDPATYNNATSVTVYDAKGQDVALTYYFQKSGADQWDVYVTANGTPISVDGTGAALPSTTMTFPANGSAPTAPVGAVPINIPATTNAAGGTTLPITGIELDVTSATQYGSGFGVTDMSQTGYAPGQLSGISIEANGVIMARYSNGQSKPGGQLELANFRNPQGLQPLATTSGHHLHLRRSGGRRGRRWQLRRAAVRRAGGKQHRPDRRAGQHDHRATRLPGQRADREDAGLDDADVGQPALIAAGTEESRWTG